MISLYDLIEAANGQLFGEPAAQLFAEFCLDVRQVRPNQLFVARRTDRGDTHEQIPEAIERGAAGILCTHPPECDTSGVTVIMARDTEQALLQWAHLVVGKLGVKVIAVTGSAGKSVAVHVTSRVLSSRYRVLEDTTDIQGPLSIPLTLAHLNPEHQFAILKLSVLNPGEMAEMVQAVQPDVGLVTQIDMAHGAHFKDRDHVASELGLLVEYLSPNNLAVLNYDDDLVRSLSARSRAALVTVGIDGFGADLLAYNIVIGPNGTGFDLRYGADKFIGRWIPYIGRYALQSVLAALAIGQHYQIPLEESLKLLSDLEPLPGRLNPLAGRGGCMLVDDTYSANPTSTLAALDWLSEIKSDGMRTVFVMGDMDDLGEFSQTGHRLIGKRAAQVADIIVTQGSAAALIGRSALDEGMAGKAVFMSYSPQDTVAIIQNLGLNQEDVLLVKGGRAARMELVVQALLQDEADRRWLVRQEHSWDTQLLFRHLRPSWVELDTNALASNVRAIKAYLGDKVAMMAVVKANAYGHGAVTVARTALLNGADYLAVANIAEALELRSAGVTAPVLVLSYMPIFAVRQAVQEHIAVALYDAEQARAFDRAAYEAGGKLRVHVKVDSGLGRLGVMADQVVPLFRQLMGLRHLEVEGIYTHFSSADEDAEYTAQQLEQFKNVLRPLRASGFQLRYIHAGNSAGLLGHPDPLLNMARPGLLLYGLRPAPHIPMPQGIRPVMSWKTVIAQVRDFPPDYPVGYGNTYRTRGRERIAILPVGYADGLRRGPQTWREVLIHGQRAPLVGRVSMEKCAVNVTHIAGVSAGDEVVLMGRQGDDEISAEEIAQWLGTSHYEVITTILPRVPRQ